MIYEWKQSNFDYGGFICYKDNFYVFQRGYKLGFKYDIYDGRFRKSIFYS